MAISKKRKHKNKSKKKINETNTIPESINDEINLMNLKIFLYSKEEILNTFKIYYENHKNSIYNDIDLKINFISMLLKLVYNNSEPDKELFGYIRDKHIQPNFYLNIIKYVYNDKIALISEATYVNDNNKRMNIEPLKGLTYLCDLIKLDLAFPAYIKNDPQEKLFKSLGFEESILKADEGQKILLRKAKEVE